MDFHKARWKDGVLAEEEPLKCCFGSQQGDVCNTESFFSEQFIFIFQGITHGCLSFKGMPKYRDEVVELAGLNVFTLGGGSGSLFIVNV